MPNEPEQNPIIKVLIIVGWVIVTIIVVALCLYVMALSGYFSSPNPIDAIPTFSQ